jgi:hypothetical protein
MRAALKPLTVTTAVLDDRAGVLCRPLSVAGAGQIALAPRVLARRCLTVDHSMSF